MVGEPTPDSVETLDPSACALMFALIARLNDDGTAAPAALREAALLEERLGLGRVDLVWDLEEVDRSMTYHLLLSTAVRTYSIGASGHSVVPWPLRGATAASADVLVTVNESKIRVWQAVAYLDFLWRSRSLMEALVDSALIAEASERLGIEATDSDVPAAVERFFMERNLRQPERREAWLAERGLSALRLEALLREVLVRRRTEEVLVQSDFEVHRTERRSEYQGLRVAQLVLDDSMRERALEALRPDPEATLYGLASRLAWDTATNRGLAIEFVELCRYELAGPGETVWSSEPGSVHVVSGKDGTSRLLSLIAREIEPSEASLKGRIVRRLLDDWLAEQRRTARVTWRWGPSERA